MKLQGSLSELKLPDILQLANMSQETGIIEFRNDEGVTGKIVLREGEVIHAHVGDLLGEEAVYEIAIWFDGSFRVIPLEEDYPPNVTGNLTGLLMESARRLDEWRVLSKKIPSLSYFPVLEDENTADRTLNTAEWDILRFIDGTRNIREVAVVCGQSPFAVSKLVYGLLINNLVSLSRFPAKEKQKIEISPLISKLLLVKQEALTSTTGALRDEIDKIVQDGLVRLNEDDSDKRAVIETANAVLQKVMSSMGRDTSRELAIRFKAILKGQTNS